ncbi:unnamed protein product [Gordionus sp. m RMFG-2023]
MNPYKLKHFESDPAQKICPKCKSDLIVEIESSSCSTPIASSSVPKNRMFPLISFLGKKNSEDVANPSKGSVDPSSDQNSLGVVIRSRSRSASIGSCSSAHSASKYVE